MEDYETLALALARDPVRLAALARPAGGTAPFQPALRYRLFSAHRIETAYLRMMEIRAQGAAPQSFAVSA